MKLTWDDLLIDFQNQDLLDLYEPWNWLLNGKFRPIMMSTFGDLFYQEKDKKIYYLDIMEGQEVFIVEDEKNFSDFTNNAENLETYLLSYLVCELKTKGLKIGENQCYAFKIAPILGGKVESNNVEIMYLRVWLHIMGQVHFQIKDLPKGTKIKGFKITD